MLFKRTASSYGQSPFPETPYQNAEQIWEFLVGLRSAKQFIWGMNCRQRTLRQQRTGSLPHIKTIEELSHVI